MGVPMAFNLSRIFHLTIWNRSASKYPLLTQAGAKIGKTPPEVAEKSDVIFTMMFDGNAIQSIFDEDLKRALQGRTLINTSSVSVNFSHQLARQVRQAGGDFIEMPVSGSKVPAEQGQLVGMVAGDRTVAERIKPVVKPITSAAIYCGPIDQGLKTKYAVNIFLISMRLAQAQYLDVEAFGKVLDAGPMASAYSRLKVAKMLNQDWSAQAAINDCFNGTQLIQGAGKAANVRLPLIELCSSLYKKANEPGLGEEDMAALVKMEQSMHL